MLGAIAGDIIGSPYEFNNYRAEDFPLFIEESTFTDDTVLTVALADAILTGVEYTQKIKEYYHRYPHMSYGGRFHVWAEQDESEPYNSYGNGSAMRCSPVGWAYDTLEEVLKMTERSAMPTHNHPEGIKGAKAVAGSIFLARTQNSKQAVKDFVTKDMGYNLDFSLPDLRRDYRFNETCQETVPQAIFCFMISTDFEDAIRKAISIGGDSDTVACITGSIAEAYYGGIPMEMKKQILSILDVDLLGVAEEFYGKYIGPL